MILQFPIENQLLQLSIVSWPRHAKYTGDIMYTQFRYIIWRENIRAASDSTSAIDSLL